MMGVVRYVVCLVVCVGLAPKSIAGGFGISGVGTKATGMAGAFRAVADDWTAAFYNPAGYAFAYDNQLGGNAGFVHFRNELIPSYRWGGEFETGVVNDRSLFNYHEILSLPSAGFIVRLPVWGETVFGLSAYQPFDYNVTWELYNLPLAYNDLLSTPRDQYRNNLDVVAFQLTAAREFVEDELALGIGAQVLRGDLLFNSLVFRDNPMSVVRPREKITQWSHNDGYGWGFGFNAGGLWKVNERLNLAATVSLPFNVTMDGTSKLEFYMPMSAEVGTPGTVEQLFLSGSEVVDSADFETTLKLPPSVALAVAYTASERLTIALDAEYTLWSQYDGFDFAYTNHRGLTGPADTVALARNFFTADLSFPIDWKDAGKVQLGASYDLLHELTLLAGVSADQSPARESETFTPLFVDTGTKYGFSYGIIVHIERWDLGLATSYLLQPDVTIPTPADFGEGEELVHFPGDYRAATYVTTLSFNYLF